MGRIQSGFTIIETMLFLAVSVGLFAALMLGVNATIAQQRYRDSVSSFEALLQDQYTKATAVANDRAQTWTCGAEIKQSTDHTTLPGTTDCLIVGRFVQLRHGSDIVTGDVIAYHVDTAALEGVQNDIEALTNAMTLTTLTQVSDSTADEETTPLDWGSTARVLDATGNHAGHGDGFTLAIIRSPLSGQVMTFAVNEATMDWKNTIITSRSLKNTLSVCVVPSFGVSTPLEEIAITANASTANGVTRHTGAVGC